MRAKEFIIENKVRPNIDIEWEGNFIVNAYINGEFAGSAEFASDDPDGEYDFYAIDTSVVPKYRRMGVATAMYNAAEEKFGEIIPSEHQTDDARAFWRSREFVLEASSRGVIYTKPDFEREWEEAARYPEFEQLGRAAWMAIAGQGQVVDWASLDSVGNVELDLDSLDQNKVQSVAVDVKRNQVELPIVGQWADGTLDLIAGNTRIATLLAQRHNPQVWLVDVPGDTELTEAFDQPYPIKWNKSEHGDYDALARLPDGTNLSILFNNEGDDEWQVEFYRNNSLEVTGEGDAQKVFATVLSAIQQFIQKEHPWRIRFSASKLVLRGQKKNSRSSLYNSLVARYAQAWGYEEYDEDHGDQVTYELTRIEK
jgi:GNAT superfamily N-acetyltransferase